MSFNILLKKEIYALCMPGILPISLCNAYGIIEFVKTTKFPQNNSTSIYFYISLNQSSSVLYLNFTLISQGKVCFLSVIDAEGQEEGVETTVNCK